MADLIAYQDGNFTGATTFKGVATGTNAKLTTLSVSTNTTTLYQKSSNFTITNAQVLEGLLLYCRRVNTTGTVSVALSDDGGVTATREVTVNASDLPPDLSWVFFKFGSTLTADGGTDYQVMVKASSAGNAVFWRDNNANYNWARYLRTNTTATAGASDVAFICDELTGAGTKNDITVTMDSTSLSTSYGQVNVGQGGVLAYGTSASTAYKLKLAGNLNVWGGGTFNMGKSGAEIPSTSTAELEFAITTNVDFGLEARSGSTVTIYGATKANTKALLTADAASGQKVFTIADTTDWAANDTVALASTTRTASQSEKGTVATVDSGTQITLSANLTNVHHGTSPYIGEVVNLTRNVKIRGTSQTLCAYVNCADTSSFTASYAEFYWLGSATASKRGIDSATTSTGTFSMSFCSMYDYFATSAIGANTTGASGAPIVEDCVTFLSTSGSVLTLTATSGVPSVQRNYFISTSPGVTISDLGGTIKDNRFGGCGVQFSEAGATIGTIKDNVQHSASSGVTIGTGGGALLGTIDGLTVWRNANGVLLSHSGMTLTNLNVYHNGTTNVVTATSGSALNCTISNSTFNGGSGASLNASPDHFRNSSQIPAVIVFDNCTFGATTQASTSAFNINNGNLLNLILRRCTVAESTVVTTQSNLLSGSFGESSIAFDKFNNTSGSHRTYKRYGYTASDQTTYKTASPSEALIPNGGSGNKLPSGSKKFAVASGTTATVTVYVNKSASYNGNQPSLIVKANSIAGISTDTVLATASGGTGSWLTLSGTTASVSDDCVLEVYVDCDGTAGTVYVDDWSIS